MSPRVSKLLPVLIFLLLSSLVTVRAASEFPRTVEDVRGRKVTIDTPPQRIFSGGLNVSSTLLKLISPDRVAAVGRFADDPAYSFVADSAARRPSYQQVQAETVLEHKPDLAILTVYTRADIRRKIMNLGIPVILTGTVNTRADIVRNTRLIGRAVGELDRADSWLDEMNKVLDEVPERSNPPRVLYYTFSGTVPGEETLPDLILSSAGLENVAVQVGINGWKVISPERLLKVQPEWLVFEEPNRERVVGKLKGDAALRSLNAVKNERFKSAEPKYLTVASPFLYRAVQHWRELFQESNNDST